MIIYLLWVDYIFLSAVKSKGRLYCKELVGYKNLRIIMITTLFTFTVIMFHYTIRLIKYYPIDVHFEIGTLQI